MRRRPLLAPLAVALALAPLLSSPSFAAAPPGSQPALVRIELTPAMPIERLLETGLDVVDVKHGAFADVLQWPGDAERIARLGAHPTLLDADPSATAARGLAADLASRPVPAFKRVWSAARADGRFRVEAAPPMGSGGMGGYWTLAEVKMKLDDLVASDVSGVVADKVDTVGTTLQGRPIWGLRLGTTVAGTDTRPAVFYNALAHAREPGGMQALIYFVDDLLSRYPDDPTAKYLLENRRIYIVPVVNPDGYERNRATNPSGGGLWRKNLRDNNSNGSVDGSDGVDINRNFAYKWGLDNIGSSPNIADQTYRGPFAASELETQAQANLFNTLRAKTGLSFHTYSDLLVHPWGYQLGATPDSLAWYEWNDEMSINNGYAAGQGPRILYSVNGEFNDWTYGDTLSKPKAFTWTPEVGGQADGFWPPISRVFSLSQDMVRPCYWVANIAGPYVRAQSSAFVEGALNAGNLAHLTVRARNVGASGAAGPGLIATLTALDHEVEVLSGPVDYPTLGSRQSGDATGGASFLVAAADTVTPGRLVRFRVDFTAPDGLFSRDTVEVLVGTPTVVMVDPCNNLINWNAGGGSWGIAQNNAAHPSRFLGDSPLGRYGSGLTNVVRLNHPLNLSAGVHAWWLLENQWTFESEYDVAVLEGSRDNVNWTPLTGRASTPATAPASVIEDTPVYRGTRWTWKPERIDLSDFAGGPFSDSVWVRMTVRSDNGFELDGLNVDSLRILVFDPAAQPAPVAVGSGVPPRMLEFAAPVPNPARGYARFEFALPRAGRVRLDVLDVQGRLVRTLHDGALRADRYVRGWDLTDDAGRAVAPGVYLARLSGDAGDAMRRLVVLR